MQKFSTWLEQAMFNMNTNSLEGEPYMDVDWKEAGKTLVLKIRYRWKGYSILPHQKGYAKPDEFAAIELHQLAENPNYFYLDGIGTADPFQREGYATALVKKALELIKAKGFKGIVSSADGSDRTPDSKTKHNGGGDSWWKSLKPRRVGEYDVYE